MWHISHYMCYMYLCLKWWRVCKICKVIYVFKLFLVPSIISFMNFGSFQNNALHSMSYSTFLRLTTKWIIRRVVLCYLTWKSKKKPLFQQKFFLVQFWITFCLTNFTKDVAEKCNPTKPLSFFLVTICWRFLLQALTTRRRRPANQNKQNSCHIFKKFKMLDYTFQQHLSNKSI